MISVIINYKEMSQKDTLFFKYANIAKSRVEVSFDEHLCILYL